MLEYWNFNIDLVIVCVCEYAVFLTSHFFSLLKLLIELLLRNCFKQLTNKRRRNDEARKLKKQQQQHALYINEVILCCILLLFFGLIPLQISPFLNKRSSIKKILHECSLICDLISTKIELKYQLLNIQSTSS